MSNLSGITILAINKFKSIQKRGWTSEKEQELGAMVCRIPSEDMAEYVRLTS